MPPADLVILGAAVRTLDLARPRATAVAVRDGLIAAVGDDAEVREHIGAGTETVDGTGIALVPGLVDAHIHPFHGTDGTRGADLQGLRTVDEVRGALQAERARCAPGEWVLGWGLPTTRSRPAHRCRGDRRRGGRRARLPHVLRLPLGAGEPAGARARRHRRRAGVRRGRRGRVDDGGAPTGELHERPAMDLVGDLVPRPHAAQRLDAYAETLRA